MNINGDYSTSEYTFIVEEKRIFFKQEYFETPVIQRVKNFTSAFSSFIFGTPVQISNIKALVAKILFLKAKDQEEFLQSKDINLIASTIQVLKNEDSWDLYSFEFSFSTSSTTKPSKAQAELNMEYPITKTIEEQKDLNEDSDKNPLAANFILNMEYSIPEPKQTIKKIKNTYFQNDSFEEFFEDNDLDSLETLPSLSNVSCK